MKLSDAEMAELNRQRAQWHATVVKRNTSPTPATGRRRLTAPGWAGTPTPQGNKR